MPTWRAGFHPGGRTMKGSRRESPGMTSRMRSAAAACRGWRQGQCQRAARRCEEEEEANLKLCEQVHCQ
jgi:hypothetical protein